MFSCGGGARRRSTGIDPLTLANLELYLRSDQVSGVNNDPVASWSDLSSHGRTFTQAAAARKPKLLIPGSANGQRLVRFDGANDPNGDNMGAAFSLPGPGSGYTFYFYGVWNATTNTPNGAALFFSTPGGRPNLIVKEAGATTWGWSDSGLGSHLGGTHPDNGTAQTLVWVFPPPSGSGTGKVYKVTGSADVSGTWSFDGSAATGWFLGDNNDPGVVACKVDLGAAVVFSEAHNDATRIGVVNYLTNFFEG